LADNSTKIIELASAKKIAQQKAIHAEAELKAQLAKVEAEKVENEQKLKDAKQQVEKTN
jgi:hypothetical protein